MTTIEFLVATMNQPHLTFFEKMNINTQAVIVNQLTHKTEGSCVIPEKEAVKCISYEGKGLSKSRNIALQQATADIVVVADDDVQYVDDVVAIIDTAYQTYQEADMICFIVERTGTPTPKKFRTTSSEENYLSILKVSSVEITFKRSAIEEKGLLFNELIGAGEALYCGEESAFLYAALRAGLTVRYVPIKIGTTDMSTSTWFSSYNQQYFESKGAAFYAMTSRWYRILMIQFIIRKQKIVKGDYTYFAVLKMMSNGVKAYKKARDAK